MSLGAPPNARQLLAAYTNSDDDPSQQLFTRMYAELQRLAHRQLNAVGRPGQTLNTTALVHETYLKLAREEPLSSSERAHFFALVARVMRQVIIDYARRGSAEKRGGQGAQLSLTESQIALGDEADALLALDEAMQKLATLDERLVRVVECRFFAGLSEDDTASALGMSLRTVQRDWQRARGWLKEDLGLTG